MLDWGGGGGGKYSAKFTELYDQNYQSIFFCDIYLYLYVLQQTQIIVVLEQDEHLPFKSFLKVWHESSKEMFTVSLNKTFLDSETAVSVLLISPIL